LFSRNGVFGIATRESTASSGFVQIINAFSLTHGVEGEDDEAELHESLAAALIARIGFALPIMSALKEDRRKWAPSFGHVKVGRNEQVRPAFIHKLLDAVARTPEFSGRTWIQGCSCFRAANQFPKEFANMRLASLDLHG
jgi:hypothetical protein